MTVASRGSSLLYVCSAVIVLDGEGKRLLVKYYGHDQHLASSKKAQEAFEATLYQRTRKALNSNSLS